MRLIRPDGSGRPENLRHARLRTAAPPRSKSAPGAFVLAPRLARFPASAELKSQIPDLRFEIRNPKFEIRNPPAWILALRRSSSAAAAAAVVRDPSEALEGLLVAGLRQLVGDSQHKARMEQPHDLLGAGLKLFARVVVQE